MLQQLGPKNEKEAAEKWLSQSLCKLSCGRRASSVGLADRPQR